MTDVSTVTIGKWLPAISHPARANFYKKRRGLRRKLSQRLLKAHIFTIQINCQKNPQNYLDYSQLIFPDPF